MKADLSKQYFLKFYFSFRLFKVEPSKIKTANGLPVQVWESIGFDLLPKVLSMGKHGKLRVVCGNLFKFTDYYHLSVFLKCLKKEYLKISNLLSFLTVKGAGNQSQLSRR